MKAPGARRVMMAMAVVGAVAWTAGATVPAAGGSTSVRAVPAAGASTSGQAVPAAGGPGMPPDDCAPGVVPNPGLDGAHGCLTQTNEAGFMLSPHVLHPGDRITGTVIPGSIADRWDWRAFEATLGAGARNRPCQPSTPVGHGTSEHLAGTTCTITVGPRLASSKWQVYSMAISVPVVGGPNETVVASDYFTVDSHLFELGGLVTEGTNRLGQPKPLGNVTVQLVGRGVVETEMTSPLGRYAFAVAPGRYRVQVLGNRAKRALPTSIPVTVTHNVTSADFQVDARDLLAISVAPLGAATAGDATIAAGASAATLTSRLTNAQGVPKTGKITTTPPQQMPKALFCTSSGLLYPQLGATGSPISFNPFVEPTDAAGSSAVTMYAGSEPGAYPVDQSEGIRRNPGMASTVFDLGTAPRQPLQNAAQNFYNAVASEHGIFQIEAPAATATPGQVVAARSGAQEVLLAFLEAHFSQIGIDFGPVYAGGANLAGIEFYDANDQVVMDTQTARDILVAASTDQPLPAQDNPLPSLAAYEAAVGQVTDGHLTPDPSDPLTYFGWPYPPLSADGLVDSHFFSNCVKPDPQQLRVEVDAPVDLLFTDPAGDEFGIDKAGHDVANTTGLEFPGTTGGETTYILPAQSYSVRLTGGGTATGHVTVFSAGPTAENTQAFTLPVLRGASGGLELGTTGAIGPLRFGGHQYLPASSLTLSLTASHHLLPRTHQIYVLVHVLDAVGHPLPGATVTTSAGRGSGQTNRAGEAAFTLPPQRPGPVRITAAAPGMGSGTLTIQVR